MEMLSMLCSRYDVYGIHLCCLYQPIDDTCVIHSSPHHLAPTLRQNAAGAFSRPPFHVPCGP